MSQYAKLMLITETTREITPAFARAVHLARATGAQLHVFAFCHDPLIDALGSVNVPLMERTREDFLEGQQRALHQLVDPLAAEGVAAYLEVIPEPPHADVALSRIMALRPDLVLKDVHPEPLIARLFLQAFDWELLNLSPAPLLLVNPRAAGMPARIVAAVDSGVPTDLDLNDEVTRSALALAIQCDADAHLVHVGGFQAATAGEGRIRGVPRSSAAYLDLAHLETQRFRELAERFNVPADRRHLLTGPVASTLAEFVRDPAGDVLVIGAAYRSGIERFFLGRNAQTILQKARSDVLVVKPADFYETVQRKLFKASRKARTAEAGRVSSGKDAVRDRFATHRP